jgi:hypothetical protein
MATARLAGNADELGPRLQIAGIVLGPAHRVIDVGNRRRIGRLVAGAEIERDRDDAVRCHIFVAQMLGRTIAHAPGAAVGFDQSRERPLPARREDARQQRFVAVAQIFDIGGVVSGGLGFENGSGHGGLSYLSLVF